MRRTTDTKKYLAQEVSRLRNKTDQMDRRLEAASTQNQETIGSLNKVIDVAFDDRRKIEELSRDLADTKSQLASLESKLVHHLDGEQKDIARRCNVTEVEFACEYFTFLHKHKHLIEEVQKMRAY